MVSDEICVLDVSKGDSCKRYVNHSALANVIDAIRFDIFDAVRHYFTDATATLARGVEASEFQSGGQDMTLKRQVIKRRVIATSLARPPPNTIPH